MRPVWRRKSARNVVVPNEILCVGGELRIRRIEEVVAWVVHESWSDCDLKFRTVVGDGQYRLCDVVDNAEIPGGRRSLRHSLGNSLQPDVMRAEIPEGSSRRGVQREESVVPLRGLKRCRHGYAERGTFGVRDGCGRTDGQTQSFTAGNRAIACEDGDRISSRQRRSRVE